MLGREAVSIQIKPVFDAIKAKELKKSDGIRALSQATVAHWHRGTVLSGASAGR